LLSTKSKGSSLRRNRAAKLIGFEGYEIKYLRKDDSEIGIIVKHRTPVADVQAFCGQKE
jgi:hypothetical protein